MIIMSNIDSAGEAKRDTTTATIICEFENEPCRYGLQNYRGLDNYRRLIEFLDNR